MKDLLKKCKCKNPDLAILLLRLGTGAIFLYHGWVKLQNVAGTTAFFDSLGLPVFFVYLAIGVELLGGAALVLGILVEYLGWLLAAQMLAAILLVKLNSGWAALEFELLLLLASASIALTGGGKYTLMPENGKSGKKK